MNMYNIWLLPYSKFIGTERNDCWAVACKVAETLRNASMPNTQYRTRIKRVGVNIFDADEAVAQLDYLAQAEDYNSPHLVIAFGEYAHDFSGPRVQFEYTGGRDNHIGDQYDVFGQSIGTIDEWSPPNLENINAAWYSDPEKLAIVKTYNLIPGRSADDGHELSPGAGDYLCGYMTEKLATTSSLSSKAFFIHINDFDKDDRSENAGRDEEVKRIVGFIEEFAMSANGGLVPTVGTYA